MEEVMVMATKNTNGLTLLFKVFLPFAAAYFLSYLLRNVNAVIAPVLSQEFEIGAGQIGTLTAAYFFGFAAMQIPIGACLDRFSPNFVQAALYLIAATGVLLFGAAHSPTELLVARLLIGIGVAAGLVAGLKTIVLWFPKDRVPLVNGAFIGIGTLGAVAATAPTELLLSYLSWRALFLVLACICAAIATALLVLVPREPRVNNPTIADGGPPRGYRDVLMDPRFWRLAPLSGISIGSAWALQGLWAGSWFSDVAAFDRPTLVAHLFAMSVALSVGALGLGVVIHAFKQIGVGPTKVLPVLVTLLMTSELALALRQPLPAILPWCLIAIMGAGTVVTYSITALVFEKSILGRLNGAINLFHIGGAFILQSGIGFLIARWPQSPTGHYPPAAYTATLLCLLALQFIALAWYLRPTVRIAPPKTKLGTSFA
jgi:MFS family permease